jgi:hypothetical protein
MCTMEKIVRVRHASEPSFQSTPEECMNVLRTACAGAAVLALAFGAASPVYAAAPTGVAHVTLAQAGDGWWGHHRHHGDRDRDCFRDGWGDHGNWGDRGRDHGRDHDHGRGHDGFRFHRCFVHAGGGAMAKSVAGLTAHIGG